MAAVLKKLALYFVLIAVPLTALSPLWFHAYAMAFDMADYFLPNRYFLGECLRSGIFPWWNPYSGLGIPFSADPQSGAFYPIAWFFGLIGYNFYTINLEYLLHLIIAGWGMYRLIFAFTKSATASVCMAMCYQLCGVFIGNAQHLTWVISAAWAPWVLCFWKKMFEDGDHKTAAGLALSLMMMTTGGYPAFLIMLVYFFAISLITYWIGARMKRSGVDRRILIRLMVAAAAFLIITAPFILSFLQLLPHFTRSAALENDPSFVLAFPPAAAVSFIFPAAVTHHAETFGSDVSMLNSYVGLLPLILLVCLLISPQPAKVRALFLVSVFLLIISFGHSFFLWNLLFDYVPLVNRIRFPAAFRLPALIGFLICAALVMNNAGTYKRISAAAGAVLITIAGAALAAFAKASRQILPSNLSVETLQSFYKSGTIENSIVAQSFFQVLFILLLLIAFALRSRISQPRFHALLMAVVACDMMVAARMNAPASVVSAIRTNSLNAKLNAEPDGFPLPGRMKLSEVTHEGDGSYAPSYFNNNIFKKQLAFNSYNPLDLKNKDSLDRFAHRQALFDHPLLYAGSSPGSLSTANLVAGDVLVHEDFSVQKEIASGDSLKSEITMLDFTPIKVTAEVKTNQVSLLTLLQNHYPGWQVRIDGVPAPIIRSNISMMAVALPGGIHTVQFEYDPQIRRWLLYLSMAMQPVLLAFLVFGKKRL